MKIGLGVITSGKRAIRHEYTSLAESGSLLHMYVDKDRRGGAHNRNQVIKSLYDAGCDYIFLMDDDVYPVRKGWQNYFIEFMNHNSVDFIGTAWPDTQIIGHKGNSICVPDVTIQFCAMSRKAVDTIGYLDQRYGSYAPEDADYAWRAKSNGLTGTNRGHIIPYFFSTFIHVEDFISCFEQSTFTDEQKQDGFKSAGDLLSQKASRGENGYIAYDQGADDAE